MSPEGPRSSPRSFESVRDARGEADLYLALQLAEGIVADDTPIAGAVHFAARTFGVNENDLMLALRRKLAGVREARAALERSPVPPPPTDDQE